MNKNKSSHATTMLSGTILIWIISIGVFLLITILLTSPLKDWTNGAGSAGSFLQGTLGVAVAFAGAWVAIKIASFANETIRNQERREQFEFCIEKVEYSFRLHMQVKNGLQELYGEMAFLQLDINRLIKSESFLDDWRKINEATFEQSARSYITEKHSNSTAFKRAKGIIKTYQDLLTFLDSYRSDLWSSTFHNAIPLRKNELLLIDEMNKVAPIIPKNAGGVLKLSPIEVMNSLLLKGGCDASMLTLFAIHSRLSLFPKKLSAAAIWAAGPLCVGGTNGSFPLAFIFSRFQYSESEFLTSISSSMAENIFGNSAENLSAFIESPTMRAASKMGCYDSSTKMGLDDYVSHCRNCESETNSAKGTVTVL